MVSANRAGFGFVRVEGREEAIFLPPREMMGVMHGDRVRVSVERQRDGRYSGRLEKVLEHATKGGGVVASETQLVPRGVEQLKVSHALADVGAAIVEGTGSRRRK